MFSERLQILVSPEQRRRLEAEARRRGTSVAALIRESVDVHLGTPAGGARADAIAGIQALRGRALAPEEIEHLVERERTGAEPS